MKKLKTAKFRKVAHADRSGVVVRTEVGIREVSLATFPQYEQARILAVRNAERPALTIARRRLEVARLRLTDKDN